ncbi:hypothetical protein MRX96_039716 [Rhipicephalus microplus]
MLLLRSTFYMGQIDTCRIFSRIGLRKDVCHTPYEKVCENCGIKPTEPNHECVIPSRRCAATPTLRATTDAQVGIKSLTSFVVETAADDSVTTTNSPGETRSRNSRRPSNQPHIHRGSNCVPPPRIRL